MKYGLLFHGNTTNLGDDIQTYAISRFLPRIDYYVDRDNIDVFKSENNEPVATIMAAWWMWKKFDWPPAECIVPKMVSMHFNNYSVRENASPVTNEWLQGIGGEYFKAYGPVGVRDEVSLDFLRENNIDAYFSGCVTLTLPKQRETEDKGKYVVVADLNKKLEKKVRKWLKNSGLEIRTVTHKYEERQKSEDIEERLRNTEKVLTLYQNARFVVTRRLHITLPCLAMGVPVISVVDMDLPKNYTRWKPYSEWTNFISEKDVLSGNIDFDYNNPTPNKTDYLPTREKLIEEIEGFIREMEALPENIRIEELKKTDFTETEARKWQYDLMRDTLDKWLYVNREILKENKLLSKSVAVLEKENESLKKELNVLREEKRAPLCDSVENEAASLESAEPKGLLGKLKSLVK